MTDNKMKAGAEDKSANPVLKIIKAVSSMKLTVVGLVILTILVVWGTVYQAENGLYQAQVKFFYSWVFFIFGFIPFPGTIMVMFVLFINLLCSLYLRIEFRLSNIGSLITHLGIVILLVGGGLTFYFSEESSLMLREGTNSSMSASRLLWEIAVWEEKGGEKDVYAVDTSGFSSGKQLEFQDLGIRIAISNYYSNCSPMTSSAGGAPLFNGSGIRSLREKGPEKEVAQNVAGVVMAVEPYTGSTNATVLLFGQEDNPTGISINNRSYGFKLRKKKIQLPLNVSLTDFRLKMYPNSRIPKSYESSVKIKGDDGLERDVVISMNKPLRYKNLTFFQSSYYIAPDKTEYSIFAVVKNSGRLLPYISSIIIFLGMVIHFIMMLLRRRKEAPPVVAENE